MKIAKESVHIIKPVPPSAEYANRRSEVGERKMAFWSSQTLESKLSQLVKPATKDSVDCNAITLTVGKEIFVTPHVDEVNSNTKRNLVPGEPFPIPPQQFAFIMTEETVKVPTAAMAFISMKATFKMQGLINVSGFHVDPGWDGPLIFAVFNAGPAPVHLQRGLPLFLIWYADLDEVSKKRKSKPGEKTIPPQLIGGLSTATDSLYALDKRLKEEIENRRDEDEGLSTRIHDVARSQEQIKVTFAIVLTLLTGLFLFTIRNEIASFGSSARGNSHLVEKARGE